MLKAEALKFLPFGYGQFITGFVFTIIFFKFNLRMCWKQKSGPSGSQFVVEDMAPVSEDEEVLAMIRLFNGGPKRHGNLTDQRRTYIR